MTPGTFEILLGLGFATLVLVLFFVEVVERGSATLPADPL